MMRRGLPRRRTSLLPVVLLFVIAAVGAAVFRDQPSTPASDSSFSGKVVGIADGDTIRVLRSGEEVRVRLFGIDAPERGQAYGTASRRFASDAVFGKTVTVVKRGEDRYGRTLGWVVQADGAVLNIELVAAGMAWWYRAYAPREKTLERAERQARSAKRGLWREPNAQPPWDYRRSGAEAAR